MSTGQRWQTSPRGVHAPGYQFTAYLRWAGFRDAGNDILLAEMDSGSAGELISASKDRIRDYFRGRAAEKQQDQINAWEAEGAYPDFGERDTAVKVAERQAFDLVALSAATVVNEGTPRSRRLALNLIKTALESGPTALQDILLNVLELPQDKVEELRALLDRTTLASVIEAAKRIADRLDFLAGLEALIFDADSKKQTLERRQLHRILANETWVFGEKWTLTGDDDRLTKVLAAHLRLLGDDVNLAGTEPVLREDGTDAIADLVLSRTMQTAENKCAHLVVELKRPSHTVTPTTSTSSAPTRSLSPMTTGFSSPTCTGPTSSSAIPRPAGSMISASRSASRTAAPRSRRSTRSGSGTGPRSSATPSTGTSSSGRALTTRPPTTPALIT
jgi:hypothetical protein